MAITDPKALAPGTAELKRWELDVSQESRVYTAIFLYRVPETDGGTPDYTKGPYWIYSQHITGLPWLSHPTLQNWDYEGITDTGVVLLPPYKIQPFGQKEGERVEYYTVECKFSNVITEYKAGTGGSSSPDSYPKFSGGFVQDRIEAQKDYLGHRILSSSLEAVKGPAVEFDFNRPIVSIEQIASEAFMTGGDPPNLFLICRLQNRVNGQELWGLDERTIKINNCTWDQMYYLGQPVYHLRWEFEVAYNYMDTDTSNPQTWDRTDIVDEGTKMVSGHWTKSGNDWVYTEDDGIPVAPFYPTEQSQFIRARDPHGELMHVLLDGGGRMIDDEDDPKAIPLISRNLEDPVRYPGAVMYYHPFMNADLQYFGFNTDNFFGSTNPRPW